MEILQPSGSGFKRLFLELFGSQDLISVVKNEYQLMSMMECGSELLRCLLPWAGRRGQPPH